MKVYVSTALPYVNDRPHLGHAYEAIGTDALARFHRQRGAEVFFLTGTDENATKNEDAARKAGMETKAFVDQNAERFKQLDATFGISYDRFIRTTDPDHLKGVHEFLRRWIANDDVYLNTYEGSYCSGCEAFYETADLVDGRCKLHPDKPDYVQVIREENYFFRLTKYEQRLKDLFREHPDFTEPESRRNEVLGWLDRGLKDISVSRGRSLAWGIPWPDRPEHTVYVWFDALINYVTGVGFGTDEALFKKWWPADVHVIGKDITRFHCIYWPAMLMAAGIELPKKVFVHGFLEFGGQKMSKSSGNMIDPLEAAERLGVDGVRYLVLREAPFDKDSPISPEGLDARFNADLANGLGNLVARSTAMAAQYFDGRVPAARGESASARGLREIAERAVVAHAAAAPRLRFSEALAAIFEIVDAANRHYTVTQPWQLAKDPARRAELEDALYAGLEAVRLVGYLLWPYMPTTASRICEQLGVAAPDEVPFRDVAAWGGLRAGAELHPAGALFPRLDRPAAV